MILQKIYGWRAIPLVVISGLMVLYLLTHIPRYSLSEALNKNIVLKAPPSTDEEKPLHQTAPTQTFDTTKVALIIETRPLSNLPALINHMVGVVPPEWTFKFVGSQESMSSLRLARPMQRYEASGKLNLVELPSQWSSDSRENASRMLTDLSFYKDFLRPAEWLLVFQPDSVLCANSEQDLNDWLEYDWVGAPWTFGGNGGNGGLSIRRVSSIVKVLEKSKRPDNDGMFEDWWLCKQLELLPGSKVANSTVEARFSVESVWYDRPLGYHIGWMGVHHGQIWDSKQHAKHIYQYCPEVKLLMSMKIAKDTLDKRSLEAPPQGFMPF